MTRIIIVDASVLINLLHVDRIDIRRRVPGFEFVVSDHVVVRLKALMVRADTPPSILPEVAFQEGRYQQNLALI